MKIAIDFRFDYRYNYTIVGDDGVDCDCSIML